MKVIDERGRLFGRINIIDLLVVLAVLFVGVIIGGKLLGGGEALGGSTKLTYTVKAYDVKPEVYQSMQTMTYPDQLMADGSLLNANVISMTPTPSKGRVYQIKPNPTDSTLEMQTGESGTYDLTFVVEAYVANDVINELGTQEIRVGKTHILKTRHFEFEEGIITSCIQEGTPTK